MLTLLLWFALAMGAASTVQEKIQQQQTIVDQLESRLNELEQAKDQNALDEVRRQLESEWQALQDANNQQSALGAQAIATPSLAPNDVALDIQVAELQSQIQLKQTSVHDLYQRLFTLQQSNMASIELDRTTELYNEELASLSKLQQQLETLRAQKELGAQLAQTQSRVDSELLTAELQRLNAQRAEHEKNYESLLKKYEEMQRQAEARQTEIDDLYSRYLDAKRVLDTLRLSVASNPSG